MRAQELRPDDVVVTGRGIISPIGNSLVDATAALQNGRSGLAFDVDLERMILEKVEA